MAWRALVEKWTALAKYTKLLIIGTVEHSSFRAPNQLVGFRPVLELLHSFSRKEVRRPEILSSLRRMNYDLTWFGVIHLCSIKFYERSASI